VATLTKVKGPISIGGGMKIACYNLAFDTGYPSGGEPIDLTGEFDYVYAVIPAGNDTLADNGYKAQAIQPAPATAVSSSNVTITLHEVGSAGAMTEFSTTDASAIGQCSIVVIGF